MSTMSGERPAVTVGLSSAFRANLAVSPKLLYTSLGKCKELFMGMMETFAPGSEAGTKTEENVDRSRHVVIKQRQVKHLKKSY